jgi:acetyl esterase/lipase
MSDVDIAALGLAAGFAASLAAWSSPAVGQPLIVDVDRGPDEVLTVWPDGAPGGEGVELSERLEERTNVYGLADHSATDVTDPTLSVFFAPEPDGSAILIAPGGGYSRIVVEHEGWETARWFARQGSTVFVMTYRLPHQGWQAGADAPLQDIQRAIRVIRARADEDDVDANRIMVLGFSAGGHLAGSLALRFGESAYLPIDAADRLSARPDAVALLYPVVTMREPYVHMGSRQNLIGASPSPESISKYSLESSPPPNTPPVILIHAGDDSAVPVENSIRLYAALKQVGVPASLHVFERGGHGFGMRGLDDDPLARWPQLVVDFGRAHGLFGESD